MTQKHSEVGCLQARREIRAGFLLIGVMRYLREVIEGDLSNEASAYGVGNSIAERALNLNPSGTPMDLLSTLITSSPCKECLFQMNMDFRLTVVFLSRQALSGSTDNFLTVLKRCL